MISSLTLVADKVLSAVTILDDGNRNEAMLRMLFTGMLQSLQTDSPRRT
jgi:hypothetical protein